MYDQTMYSDDTYYLYELYVWASLNSLDMMSYLVAARPLEEASIASVLTLCFHLTQTIHPFQ